ncbi:hypothetical protein KI387_007895, partial [Taxus chinensis]
GKLLVNNASIEPKVEEKVSLDTNDVQMKPQVDEEDIEPTNSACEGRKEDELATILEDFESFMLSKVENERNELKDEEKEVFDTKDDQLKTKEKEKLVAILGKCISYKSKVPSNLKGEREEVVSELKALEEEEVIELKSLPSAPVFLPNQEILVVNDASIEPKAEEKVSLDANDVQMRPQVG